jgi:tripartite-type tricarboxylate transporter receptor subunit TctC
MKMKLLSSLLLIIAMSAQAAEYKIFTPNSAASGGSDTVARRLSELYQKKTGNSLVVVNAPGGNHIVAVNAFKQESTHAIAAITPTSTMMVYNYLDNLPYQDSDFDIVGEFGSSENIYFVNPRSGVNSPKDLVGRLAQSDKPFIGSHATSSLVNINALHKFLNEPVSAINYKNPSDVVLDVAAGNIDAGCVAAAAINLLIEMEQVGKIKIIGTTANQPVRINGHMVPSVSKDLKIVQYNNYVWLAITPGSTPEHQRLARDLQELMQTAEMQEVLASVAYHPSGRSADQIIKTMRKSILENRDLAEIK